MNNYNGVDIDNNSVEFRVEQILKDKFELTVPTDIMNTNVTLKELGINSITFIQIIVSMEIEFDFDFNDDDLDMQKFQEINSLVKYIKQVKIL